MKLLQKAWCMILYHHPRLLELNRLKRRVKRVRAEFRRVFSSFQPKCQISVRTTLNQCKQRNWLASRLKRLDNKQRPLHILRMSCPLTLRLSLRVVGSTFCHMLRLYCPPTSNNASVICPREQTLHASINNSKMLPPSIAANWTARSCSLDSSALRAISASTVRI